MVMAEVWLEVWVKKNLYKELIVVKPELEGKF